MPYDDMDRFVAFSKCLAGFGPDRVVDDNRFSELASKIIVQMNNLLDKMNQPAPQSFEEAASEFVDKHGGLVAAPGVGVETYQDGHGGSVTVSADKRTQPPVATRDALLHSCREALQHFERGVSFERITKGQLNFLTVLSNEAAKFRAAVERYQLQNRGRR